MRPARALALVVALLPAAAASARAAGGAQAPAPQSLEELCRQLRQGNRLAAPGQDNAAKLLPQCAQAPAARRPADALRQDAPQAASPMMKAAQARVTAAAKDPRWHFADPGAALAGGGAVSAAGAAGQRARVVVRTDYKPGYQRPAAAPPAPKAAAAAAKPLDWAAALRSWGQQRMARARNITREGTGDSPAAWLRRKWLSLTGQVAVVDSMGADPAGTAELMARKVAAEYRAGQSAPRATPAQERRILAEKIQDEIQDPFTHGEFKREIGRPLAKAVSKCGKDTSWWTCLEAGSKAIGDALMLVPAGAGESAAARAGAETATGLAAAEKGAAAAEELPALVSLREAKPDLYRQLTNNYRSQAAREKRLAELQRSGASRAEQDALRRQAWRVHNESTALQKQSPLLQDAYKDLAPGTPAPRDSMLVMGRNMGTGLRTMKHGIRLGSERSVARTLKEGLMPNAGKAADGITGSAAHLVNDGSPHLVSVADGLNDGVVLLMTGYADARRAKTESGVVYEFADVEGVPLAESRKVFHGPMDQGEWMVSHVPKEKITGVRRWRSRLDPDDPKEILFEYSDPVALNEDVQDGLQAAEFKHTRRVKVPDNPEDHQFWPDSRGR